MSSPGSSGRRRAATRQYSAEDQALDQIAKEAEARLASRRAARAEAREIRMRELERQQQEAEEKQDRRYGMMNEQKLQPRVYTGSSRRSSDSSSSTDDGREIKRELSQLEERYKKAMMSNAQLDNEKQTYRFQVDLLKDQMEDMEEQLLEVQREHRDRCKELEHKKRDYNDLQNECAFLKQQLQQRDELIHENGLVYVSNGTMEDGDASSSETKTTNRVPAKETGLAALITPEAAEILGLAEGSLDERLKIFAEEKQSSQAEIKKLRQQLEDEKERNALSEKYSTPPRLNVSNGPEVHLMEVQMEAQKQLNDYKYKLKKAEQDITTLEGNVLRLESQVKRYRTAAEGSEKGEEGLKQEKRKLQRELREAQGQLEEFQTANYHLQKRIDKMKSGRNAYK